ncbi:MAG: hypothetical protein KBT04_07745, partial [Bacteroidales bacterium]|nr:hypothetical protein [Candidatus Colimorpha onthohippi]
VLAVLATVLPFVLLYAQDVSDEVSGATRTANEWTEKNVFEQNRLYPRANVYLMTMKTASRN